MPNKPKVISPMSTLDFGEILNKWNDTFDKDISSGTSNWKLINTSVAPGKDTTKVVLLFEQKVVINDRDTYSVNKYRVLLYDLTMEPMLLRSSEFQYTDLEVTGAWFIDNKLFVVRKDCRGLHIVDQITGDGKIEVFKVGYGITKITTDQKGNFVVGYDCSADDPDHREVMYVYKRGEDNDVLSLEDVMSCDAVSIDSHNGIWAYLRPFNYIHHTSKKEIKYYSIGYSGFDGLGVSDDGKILVGAIPYPYGDHSVIAFKVDDEDWFGDPVELALEIEGETIRTMKTCVFNGNKALIGVEDKLYMLNIDELTWKEIEENQQKKENKKKKNN